MNMRPIFSPGRLVIASLLLVLVNGCSTLRQATAPQPSFYSLDNARTAAVPIRQGAKQSPGKSPTLIVNPPHAAPGFDSPRIIYVREAHKLEYFSHSEWADTPARMLAPLIVAALERSGTFGAVVLTPSAAAGELRLDTEILRLQQDFGGSPSRVRFTLRAYVVDNTNRKVLAWRDFDASVAAPSEDAHGGVIAANSAVEEVLEHLVGFCADVVETSYRAATMAQDGQ